MITIATLLWDPNGNEQPFSRMYDETWVEKLYFGFRRNLTVPFEFVCFTDRPRKFMPGAIIKTELLTSEKPGYSSCIEPYRLGKPMILVGLDTIVVGNIDHLARYALLGSVIALPRDPYHPDRACNGVALVPSGMSSIARNHRGENDMDWMRAHPHAFIDDLFPEQVISYKVHVKGKGLGDARIVYFHGHEKPHEIEAAEPWVSEHWRIP